MEEHFRTPPSVMTERLNVNYYRPIFLENQQKIKDAGATKFGTLYSNSGIGHTGSVEPHYALDEVGVPFISGKAIKNNKLLIDVAEKILFDSHHNDLAKSQLQPEYLLVVRKGDVGNTCVVPADVEELNCSSEVMFFECKNQEDSYYLSAFFNSRHGELATKQLQRGSLIPGVSLYDIPDLQVLYPNYEARHYIGDKVRQAERLRERSTELEKSIKKHFDFLTSDLQPKRKSWRIISKKVESYRLNPSHYDSVVLSMLDDAEDRVDLVRLGSLFGMNGMSGGATPEGAEYPEEGIFFVRVQNVKPLRLNLLDSVYLSSDQDEELRRSRCDAGDIILTITGYPGVAAIVTEEDLPININQHSVRFDIREGWEAEYIVAALNTNFLKMQVNRFAIGATRDALDYPSVSNLLIPVLPVETRQKIAQDVIAANLATRASERLVTAAKFLVEALIEGNITELELQEAQEALQQGDTTLDRQILSRLTRKGIPGRGEKTEEPPLFPDLDALYRVLSDDDDTDEDSDWDSTPESRQRWQTPIQFSRCAAEASTPYSQDATVTLLDEEGD